MRFSSIGEFLKGPRLEARLHDNLAVRVGDANSVLLERIPQREQHFSAHVGQALLWLMNPEAQDEIQRGFARRP
jgi:hypothetical protein